TDHVPDGQRKTLPDRLRAAAKDTQISPIRIQAAVGPGRAPARFGAGQVARDLAGELLPCCPSRPVASHVRESPSCTTTTPTAPGPPSSACSPSSRGPASGSPPACSRPVAATGAISSPAAPAAPAPAAPAPAAPAPAA